MNNPSPTHKKASGPKKTSSVEEAVKKLKEVEEQVIKEAGFELPKEEQISSKEEDSSKESLTERLEPELKPETDNPHPENIVIERMRKDIEMPIEPGEFKVIEKQLQDRSDEIQDQKLRLEKLQTFLTEYQQRVKVRQDTMAELGDNIEKLREDFKKLNDQALAAKEENEKFIQELENNFKNFNL